MPQAKPQPDQLGFDFSAPAPVKSERGLVGIERDVNALVGTILNSDPRSRYEIAAKVSELLDEEVSKFMLDAWASPSREDHRVPFSRLLALVVVTDRQDLMRPILAKIGIGALIGDEVKIARIGQLKRKIAESQAEMRQLEKEATTIREEGDD